MSTQLVKVPFHGDELDAIQAADGKVFVSLRRCCENLGLGFSNQLKKLRAKSWACVVENTTHDAGGRIQPLVMIDLRTLTMWLGNVEPRKVKAEIREKLVRYQNECADALHDHFFKPAAPPPLTRLDDDPIIDGLMRHQNAFGLMIETRRRQVEMERAQADMVRTLAEAMQIATAAKSTAGAALHQSTSNHGHFTVLGYARLRGWEMPLATAARHGKSLAALCAARGIATGTMTDPRFGQVNTYPESLLDEYFRPRPDGKAA